MLPQWLTMVGTIGMEGRTTMRPVRQSRKQDKRLAIPTAHVPDLPAGVPSTAAERGFDSCPCPKDYALHGSCHLCVAYHSGNGRLPVCER